MNDTDRNIDLFHKTAKRKCSDCQNTGTIEYRVETAGHMGSVATRPCHPCQAAIVAAWPGALLELEQARTERDRLRAGLDVADAETDRLTEQLRQAPGWCLACPPGCVSCAGEGDCECYEHQDLHPEHLKAEAERLRAERDRARAERDDARRDHAAACNTSADADEALAKFQTAVDAALAGDDVGEAVAPVLGELIEVIAPVLVQLGRNEAEEARQAWAKTAQQQLAEVKAERDRLVVAVQRVCDLPLLNFSPIDDPRVAAAAEAWREAVADSVALLDEMAKENTDVDSE